MLIISKLMLRCFWESRKQDSADAEKYLSAWYKIAKGSSWDSFGSLKQTFGSADQVGNCVVFDVGNNRFRLIGRINYAKGILYVLRVMDQTDYDKKTWVADCGCHKPPPKKTSMAKKTSPKGAPASRGKTGRR